MGFNSGFKGLILGFGDTNFFSDAILYMDKQSPWKKITFLKSCV